jgi:1-aminocyclopropane-1-carboxylate deaminase/D-cysteine desulfhydrase-like pyridoxal-dependent ACC family enzyme
VSNRLAEAVAARPRCRLATLPTPLEPGPALPGGARLWVKRDDLTGLGMGGNKARKLEFLCGAALAEGADCLVTLGAAQSNHCRMTAAAGAVLGLEVHLVLGAEDATVHDPHRAGTPTVAPTGNRLLSALFGATQHVTDTADWAQLFADAFDLADELQKAGRRPYVIPCGGSTPVGAIGYVAALLEMESQWSKLGIQPSAIVFATSTGATHAGILAARAVLAADGRHVPDALGVRVATSPAVQDPGATAALAQASLGLLGINDVRVTDEEVMILSGFMGDAYAAPTSEADAAIQWAARRGAWVLDRVSTGKALAGLLALAAEGEHWGVGEDVIFVHTGGQPAVFAPGGAVETPETFAGA